MTMTETEAPSLTVHPTAFIAAVKAVTVACSKDDTLPVLMTVQLEKAGNTLTLAATDRYRLHVAELTDERLMAVPDASIHVSGKDLAAHVKAYAKSLEIELAIEHVDGLGTGRDTDKLVIGDLDSSRTFTGESAEFPRWRALIPEVTVANGIQTFSVNPAQFAEAMKACQLMGELHTPVVAAQVADHKPILTWPTSPFQGWKFQALVMPVRIQT